MSGRIRATERLISVVAGLLLCCSCGHQRPELRGSGHLYAVSLPRGDGSRLHFNRFRGQVLMVDFFTTWGPTAVVNASDYSRLFSKYQKDGLAVIGVVLDDLGPRVLEPFAQGLDLSYPLVAADEKVRNGESFFGTIGAVPMLMIFDRDGALVKIFVGHVPSDEIERVVLRVLK